MYDKITELIIKAEKKIKPRFELVDNLMYANQKRVLKAFQNNNVSARHFTPTNGYGYDDIGRDTLDLVFAEAFYCESALVRPQIVNGSHAIYLALSGLSKPNDIILSVTGEPYDTLQSAIGYGSDTPNSLKEWGVDFLSVPLCENGEINHDLVLKRLDEPRVSIVYLQRSRGYSWRLAVSIEQMRECFKIIRSKRPDVKIIVDNCYGEFTETDEPTSVGADVIAGSLIKNPGGGLAPTGGYIAGNRACIERISHRLTVPGMGREVGSYACSYQPFYQGLFMAPHTTGQCLKTAILFSAVLEELGFETMPKYNDHRSDIIQAVKLYTPEAMQSFCRAIQKVAPIDSFAIPEAWDMPGYSDQIIMAAGSFVQGATTELSADGPMRPPYIVYMQGGLTYEHGKLAALEVALNLTK